MSSFFESIFAKYQFVFRKGYSTRQCLLATLEKWKRNVDQGKVFGVLRTDCLTFDCLGYEIWIAKLNGYGFGLPALKFIHGCLLHRK